MNKTASLFIICASCIQLSQAQLTLGKDVRVDFATTDESKQILAAQDEFVLQMSPFDRASRLKTGDEVSEQSYLAFVSKNVLAWTDIEKRKITAATQDLQKKLEALSLPFPKRILLIKTTGDEEGGAAYTRSNAIVFPASDLQAPVESIEEKLCHELFHIVSRANPDLREKLYSIIGFVKCTEIAFPPELRSRKITNPDAPNNDHCIRVQVRGENYWAVPILFSSNERYDTKRGGEFFDYLQFQLLLVGRNDDSLHATPMYDGQSPKLLSVGQVSGFFDQVGKNTEYIIHPEEILADNFVLLVLPKRNPPSPTIIKKMREVIGTGP